MPGEESPVLTSVRDGVAWITLNRPARLNALNRSLMFTLLAELEALMADPDVRVLVITGAGRAFCAGGDVHNLDEVTGQGPMPDRAARLRQVARIAETLYDGPKPVIAAINGACAGAGRASRPPRTSGSRRLARCSRPPSWPSAFPGTWARRGA